MKQALRWVSVHICFRSLQELQALFRMFDNDKDGVLSIKEFEKVLGVLGRSGHKLSCKDRVCSLLPRNIRKCRKDSQNNLR